MAFHWSLVLRTLIVYDVDIIKIVCGSWYVFWTWTCCMHFMCTREISTRWRCSLSGIYWYFTGTLTGHRTGCWLCDFVQFLEVFLVRCERFLYHIYVHEYCNISNNFPVCIFPLLKFLSIVNQLLVLLRVVWFNYR